MKTHNKMMIGVGALALIATTLLAGCGGSSTEAVPAAEPAAVESAAAEVPAAAEAPASLTDGLVQPAGISDEDWTGLMAELTQIATGPPEEYKKVVCQKEPSPEDLALVVESMVASGGTSAEDWTPFFEALFENYRNACAMLK